MKLKYCIIESNDDPLKLGRVQIRIVGKHTDNRYNSSDVNYLPISNLPWAQILSPVFSPNISGQCVFGVPEQGTVGICTYIDQDEQLPLLLGTLPKVVESLPDFDKGFSDPSGINPIVAMIGESQISRLARNENITSTIVTTKKADAETSVECADETFSEPETQFDPTYPENKVIETKSGHIIEIDDTIGKERIHFYHKSGTFIEMHPNGDQVAKIKGKGYEIFVDDNNIYVKGNKNVKVDGNENVTIAGNKKVIVEGTSDLEVTGNASIKCLAEVSIEGTQVTITGSSGINLTSTGVVTLTGASFAFV